MWRKFLPGSHCNISEEVYHNKLDWKLPFTGELKIEREMIERQDLRSSSLCKEVADCWSEGWVVSGWSVGPTVVEYYWVALAVTLAGRTLRSISLSCLTAPSATVNMATPAQCGPGQAAQPVSAESSTDSLRCEREERGERRGSDSERACPVALPGLASLTLSLSHSHTCHHTTLTPHTGTHWETLFSLTSLSSLIIISVSELLSLIIFKI